MFKTLLIGVTILIAIFNFAAPAAAQSAGAIVGALVDT